MPSVSHLQRKRHLRLVFKKISGLHSEVIISIWAYRFCKKTTVSSHESKYLTSAHSSFNHNCYKISRHTSKYWGALRSINSRKTNTQPRQVFLHLYWHFSCSILQQENKLHIAEKKQFNQMPRPFSKRN